MPESQALTGRGSHKYGNEDEMAVFVAWKLADENVSEASRVTGVSAGTIRNWIKRWEREGFSDGQLMLVEKVSSETIGKSATIINKALDRLSELVDDATNIGHLIQAIDKLSGHIRLAQGKATVIREERSVDSSVVSSAIQDYLSSMGTATAQRAEEVITLDEDTVVEIPPVSSPTQEL